MIRVQHIQERSCVLRHGLGSACNDDQLLWRQTPLQQTQHAASPPVHSTCLTENVPSRQAGLTGRQRHTGLTGRQRHTSLTGRQRPTGLIGKQRHRASTGSSAPSVKSNCMHVLLLLIVMPSLEAGNTVCTEVCPAFVNLCGKCCDCSGVEVRCGSD